MGIISSRVTDCESVQRCYWWHRSNAEIASWYYNRDLEPQEWPEPWKQWRAQLLQPRLPRSFTNPWILGIGAVTLVATGVGIFIYQEMTKDSSNHEASISATKGKYEEWFNAVTEGAKPVVESRKNRFKDR